jgi:molybdopterin synthase sulfur carrier subunit
MHIKVKLFTTLVNCVPGTQAGIPFDFELDDKATVAELVSRLKIPEAEVKIVLINGRHKPAEYQLNNGDDVGLFPLIGGG